VTSFSPATGATFALLPPDNASGNFVKVVQRLPVKIEFVRNNNDSLLSRLRAGLNVDVDVHLD
jgi:membrane fusion protein (multidrug efflux system)